MPASPAYAPSHLRTMRDVTTVWHLACNARLLAERSGEPTGRVARETAIGLAETAANNAVHLSRAHRESLHLLLVDLVADEYGLLIGPPQYRADLKNRIARNITGWSVATADWQSLFTAAHSQAA